MISELLGEVAAEVRAEPIAFAAEVAQFVILVLLVYFIGWGTSKRSGIVRTALSKHELGVQSELAHARESEGALKEAHKQSLARIREARAESRTILKDAEAKAAELRAEATATADAEAARILDRANDILGNERDVMHAEIENELVSVVGEATRSLLNERMTAAEQRRLIEEHVTAAIPSLDGVEPFSRQEPEPIPTMVAVEAEA